VRLVVFAGLAVAAALVAVASCGGDDAPQGSEGTRDGGAGDAQVSAPDAPSDGTALDAATDASAPLVDTCGDAGVAAGAWVADPHLCLTVFADERTLTVPRQMAFAPNGDLFVVTTGAILALRDEDHDGAIAPAEATTFVPPFFALTHGLAFSPDGAFVYASSEERVLRWKYTLGARVAVGEPEIVVAGIPIGGHSTRTLVFDKTGRLYVSVGSNGDVDLDPVDRALRGQVRRFALPSAIPGGGLAYESGEIVASGLRNEVGLAFDSKGRLWGVENGSDGAYIAAPSADNPAEEVNLLVPPSGRFFGYPFCWTEYAFAGGLGRGTQWAYAIPDAKTDAWCRDPANVVRPAAAMPAHWAPLGVAAYEGASLPWKGDLFVAAHGSSVRVPAVGRLVARAHLDGDAIVSVTPIVGHLADGGFEEGTWDARPVDVREGPDGALYVSDDRGARIFRLGYRP